jgi:hypothetical protein
VFSFLIGKLLFFKPHKFTFVNLKLTELTVDSYSQHYCFPLTKAPLLLSSNLQLQCQEIDIGKKKDKKKEAFDEEGRLSFAVFRKNQ